MEHLEGSGTPVLYIRNTALKGNRYTKFAVIDDTVLIFVYFYHYRFSPT